MYDHLCVAREKELARLDSFLNLALAGQGQVCFVSGEAGTGKSTLVQEFARRSESKHKDLLTTIGICNAHSGKGDPYLPFREVLGMLTGDVDKKLAEGIISKENASRLKKFVIRSTQAVIDVGPDLIDVLVPGGGLLVKFGTAVADRSGLLEKLEKASKVKKGLPGLADLTMDQSHVFEQFGKVLTTLSKQKPLLVLIEDLHWADSSSVNLLFHLCRSIAESRILIVGTYRPEEIARGRDGKRHPMEDVINEFRRYSGDIRIELGEHQESDGREFINSLLDSEPNSFDENFRTVLYQRTGGHPLFTVELLRDLAEQGALTYSTNKRWTVASELDWDDLPERVEGVIEQRIGRLENELQQVLRTASVEGTRFTAEVITQVEKMDPHYLVNRLSNELDKRDRLVRAQGVRRMGQQRVSIYQFIHNLFQVYLYENLDQVQRSYLHESVGLALEELYKEQVNEIAGELARHFEEAGWIEKAVSYRLEAANQAIWSSAYQEASDHLRAGLELLRNQPEMPGTHQYEMQLQAALGPTLVALQGWGKPGAQKAFSRACELCEDLGNNEQLGSVLYGLATLHEFRGEFDISQELMKQRLELLDETADNPKSILETYELLSCSTFHQGVFSESIDHVNYGLKYYDLNKIPLPNSNYQGEDSGISCLTWRSLNLWFLGYPDQALEAMDHAVTLAETPVTVFTKATVFCRAALLHLLRGELDLASQMTKKANMITSETRYPYFWATGMIMQGWIDVIGENPNAIVKIQEGLKIHERTGAHMDRPFYLALLADAFRVNRKYEEALETLQPAIDQVRDGRPFFFEAELYRLKGEILQNRACDGDAQAAEACFQRALSVARRQNSRSLELRAAASLAEIWSTNGKSDEAHHLLTSIVSTFKEGLETKDFLHASRLLQIKNPR